MALYNVFNRQTNSLVAQVDTPSSTQACQKVAGRLRHLYPRQSIAAIAAKLYAYKEERQSFGGRPRIYG